MTELLEYVQNVQVTNLRYFNKSWFKNTKSKDVLDIIPNGLKFDLKELLFQTKRSIHPLLVKENEIFQ